MLMLLHINNKPVKSSFTFKGDFLYSLKERLIYIFYMCSSTISRTVQANLMVCCMRDSNWFDALVSVWRCPLLPRPNDPLLFFDLVHLADRKARISGSTTVGLYHSRTAVFYMIGKLLLESFNPPDTIWAWNVVIIYKSWGFIQCTTKYINTEIFYTDNITWWEVYQWESL